MPTTKSAKKNIRTDLGRHQRNIRVKSELKTCLKKIEQLVVEKKLEEASGLAQRTITKLNKAASKKIIKRNTAGRKISQLMKKLHKASGPAVPEPTRA